MTLDLDGDGIETVAGSAGAHFDHDANGFAEQTGWVGKDDGLLVWDRNGNGKIDSGRELFGDQTLLKNGQLAVNGFAALSEWDGNVDGKIDANDAIWSKLQVWKDADGDGVTDAGELHALGEFGIRSLNLANTSASIADGLGNTRTQLGSYTKADGTSSQMGNYVFARDTARATATTRLELSADIAALPDLAGFGNVYDLSQAMARDASGALKGLVQGFMSSPDQAARNAAFEKLLFKWAGADTVAAASRGGAMDARRLATLEAFLGQGFVGVNGVNPNPNAATSLNQAYLSLSETFQARLMVQTFYKHLYDAIGLTWNATTSSLELEVSGVVANLKASYAADVSTGTAKLLDFASGLKTMGDFGGQMLGKLRTAGNPLGAGFDFVLAYVGRTLIQGDASANALSGTDGRDDIILGMAGNDTLFGNGGNDTLDGGTGNDTLYGGTGNDIYLFRRGDGQDTINEYDTAAGNTDTIRFAADIAASDITASRDSGNLYLSINGTGDKITVQNWFYGSAYRVEQVQFADGTVWDMAALQAAAYLGTDNADYLSGTEDSETFIGRGGNDTLYGYGGNDTLNGGTGNDYLMGGTGNDTYLFARGDGQDTIYEYDATAGNTDTIRFAASIAASDITMSRDSSNLYLSINGTSDKITVQNWFSGSAYRVEQVQFADGTVWNTAALQAAAYMGTDGADYLYGTEDNETFIGKGGSDYLVGNGGNDVLNGGTGNDYLMGGTGNDTYLFARGDGQDTIYEYDATAGNTDTIRFAVGIAASDITASRDQGNLYLSLNGTSDKITVQNWFSGNAYKVEQVQFADGTVWDTATLQAAAYLGTDNADYLCGTSDNETFIGKLGNDYLVGGSGNDTYVFRRGDGQDTIYEYDTTAGNTDTIRFAVGIAASDITASRDSCNLYLSINGTTDKITVQNWFSGNAYKVEQVQFADGTVWNTAALQASAYLGTDSADCLSGTEDSETFIGRGGNDTLYGYGGNDTLNGGTGNDYLMGGTGNDTYLFGRGDGQDTIYEYDTTTGNTDAIRFASGIAASDITASRDQGNLYLSINGTSDKITVQNWFYGSAYRVEQVQFADGTTWNTATLQASAYMGTDGADYLYGTSDNETLIGRGGNDYLIGNGGNDALNGGTGNDYLDGGAGNDILEGMDGSDTLNDNAGNNLFSGGSGADALTGGAGNELFIGGTGNDTITTGAGADLIAFNRGDGQDTVSASTGPDNTLSLGRGIAYSDLAFSKSANNLVLSTGANESITFQDWYASTANRSVVTLQVIAEAMAGYGANSADSLLNKKVQTFDFSRLVNGFDTAKAKNPTLASWNLMNGLLDAHLASSDGAALGGDFAYQYGMNGALTGMGMAAAQDVLAAPQFGSQAQALRPWSGLSGGAGQLS